MSFSELSANWAGIWQTQKLRLFFTISAIAVGIAALSSAFSFLDGLDETVNSLLTGSDKFMVVYPNRDQALQNNESINFNLDDARAIAGISGINRISLQKSVRGISVKSFNQLLQARSGARIDIYGTDPNYIMIRNRAMAKGRFIEPTDLLNERRICVITEGIRKQNFPANDYLEQGLEINGIFFKIVGCIRPINLPAVFGRTNDDETAIFIPLTTCQKVFQQYDYDRIWLGYRKDYDNPEKLGLIKGRIQSVLTSHHGMADAFSLQTLDDLTKQPKNQVIVVSFIFWSIAVFSLLAGGIEIMNIIITRTTKSVGEGLPQEAGASKLETFQRSILESILISSVGGCGGLILGIITGKLAAIFVGIPTSLTWRFFLSGIGYTLLTGISAGLLAAKKRGWGCMF